MLFRSLFATDSTPTYSLADAEGNKLLGLFYGGGVKLLGIQFVGMAATIIWTAVTIFITFGIIKMTLGLRASAEEEIEGLDITEHGLPSAYSGFAIQDMTGTVMDVNENTNLGEDSYDKATEAQKNASVKVIKEVTIPAEGSAFYDTGMHKVSIIAKLARFDHLKRALNELGVTGMTVTQVMGCGIQKGAGEYYRGVELDATLLPKIKVEVIVSGIPVDAVIEASKKALYTGHIGDGKIFVYNVTRVVKIRTGEENYAALQDVE